METIQIDCDHLTTEEAAAFLKVPISTLYRWNHLKLIDRYKLGKRRYYKLEDLRKLLYQDKIAAEHEKEG